MATKLFVGRLSYDTSSESLQKLFEAYGKVVSAVVAFDRDSNRSKGFGFVEMEDDAAAEKAINELDGSDFEGRQIAVNVSRPRPANAPRPQQNRGGFGGGSRRY